LNEKPFVTISKVSKRKYVRSLKWSTDNKTLTITTVFYVPENDNEVDLTRIETWNLDANGRLIINLKSVETTHESWEIKGIYEKK
jgi:hypothetical protein